MLKTFQSLFLLLWCIKISAQQSEIVHISENLELIRITDHAWMHISTVNSPQFGRVSANGLIFINGPGALLFDTPWNDDLTKQLYSWITDSMNLTLAGFVANHWHEDCMGGLGYLKQMKVKSYACEKTIAIAQSKGLPVPEISFRDSLQVLLGDRLVHCYYLGAAHSTDNIVVWIPSEKILFPGCMIKSSGASNLGNTADGDIHAYPGTIQKLKDKFPVIDYIIPGHGPAGGSELIGHTLRLAENQEHP